MLLFAEGRSYEEIGIRQEQVRNHPTSDNDSGKPTSLAHLFGKECIINRAYPFMHTSCNICRINVQGFSKTI